MAPADNSNDFPRQDNSYVLLGQQGEQYVHFQFQGHFQQKPLIWDAHLYTLAYYCNKVVETCQPHQARQFIEVGEATPTGRQIRIALNLPVIDAPAILKTMIMVRQYKRLASGRYEYGEKVDIPGLL